MVLPMWTMLSPWSKQSHGCSCQSCKATNNTGTLRNLDLASGTYAKNPPEPSGTLRNLPRPSGTNLSEPKLPEPTTSGTYASIHRNPPKSSGTLPPEPTPFYTGTLRNLPQPASGTYTSICQNLPEPSSGTCSCDPHWHTPELIWAEDPISLRCRGKMIINN